MTPTSGSAVTTSAEVRTRLAWLRANRSLVCDEECGIEDDLRAYAAILEVAEKGVSDAVVDTAFVAFFNRNAEKRSNDDLQDFMRAALNAALRELVKE